MEERVMDGVLLLAHGSRAADAERMMEAVAAMVRHCLPELTIQTAYMQFCDVNIEKGLLTLMEKGVTNVKVIPYFLFDGIHIREDIPNELAAFQKAHPGLSITLGKTLGADSRLADIVADRIVS